MPPGPRPITNPSSTPSWQNGITLPSTDPNRDSRINEPWSDQRLSDWVTQYYPDLVPYLGIPSVRATMVSAGQQGWSFDKTKLLILNLPYFKDMASGVQQTSGGSGRHGGGGGGQTPQEKADALNSMMASVKDKALTYGLHDITDDQVRWISQYAITHSFGENEVNDSILNLVNNVNGNLANVAPEGTLIVDRNQMKATARQYLTELSDQTVNDYAMKIERGEMSMDGVKAVLAAQAKARFQYLAPMIDQGVAPMDYFAPTRDAIARTLEMPTESIDLMDPHWSNLIEVHDDKTNSMRAATLSEAVQAARNRPEWSKTENAQDLAATWSAALPKIFGSA